MQESDRNEEEEIILDNKAINLDSNFESANILESKQTYELPKEPEIIITNTDQAIEDSI